MQPFTKKNDNGFVLITAILTLFVLSFLGIAATKNSSIELTIAGNDRTAKEIFYSAETAAMESGHLIETEEDSDELIALRSSKSWLLASADEKENPLSYQNAINSWHDDSYEGTLPSGLDPGNKSIKLAAMDRGIAAGKDASSLKVTGTSVHRYSLYGYAEKNRGWKLIEIGYKKRF